MFTTHTCNVCNSTDFTAGPLGRLSSSGKKPQCSYCGSLERHRILRGIWDLIPSDYLARQNALQFDIDPGINSQYFANLEISIYNKVNSLDLEDINKPDIAYDIVICNQILEYVQDDKIAFSELLRVMSDTGILEMTVPVPISRDVTEDWGYPRKDFFGHYRHYGIDLIDYFRSVAPNISLVNVRGKDQITGAEDYVFFWTKSPNTRDFLIQSFADQAHIEHSF